MITLLTGLLLVADLSTPARLDSATENGWNGYVASVRAQMDRRLVPGSCFLWADEDRDRAVRIRSGEVVVAPVGVQSPGRLPKGLVHHWIGAVFIPGVSIPKVLSTVRQYDRYREFYPDVVRSSSTPTHGQNDPQRDWFSTMEKRKAMFSTIALDADLTAVYIQAGHNRAYSLADSTRLQQIQNYGDANERELEVNSPRAYLWRLSSVTRYEERDGGVYVEMESLGLSRDIPTWLRWAVAPFVRSAAAEAMAARLQQTRDAMLRSVAVEAGP